MGSRRVHRRMSAYRDRGKINFQLFCCVELRFVHILLKLWFKNRLLTSTLQREAVISYAIKQNEHFSWMLELALVYENRRIAMRWWLVTGSPETFLYLPSTIRSDC